MSKNDVDVDVDVGGLFIGRNGAKLVLGCATDNMNSVKPMYQQHVEWRLDELSFNAVAQLSELIALTRQHNFKLRSLAVSCYGPFRSLVTGEIERELSKGPLGGIKLKEFLQENLGIKNGDMTGPILSFCTDVNAYALGETVVRKSSKEELTGFVVVTEGVGFGAVHGGKSLPSAHHPEIGLLPLRIKPGDPLRPHKDNMTNSMSLEDLASNGAMRARAEKSFNRLYKSNDALQSCRNPEFWDTRAYYLAQACLSIVSVNPLHKIYIAADVDPLGNLLERVRINFNDLIDERLKTSNPVPRYAEILLENFISESASHPAPNDVGTIGVLNLALSALREKYQS